MAKAPLFDGKFRSFMVQLIVFVLALLNLRNKNIEIPRYSME